MPGFTPARGLTGGRAYGIPASALPLDRTPSDLVLSSNEGPAPAAELLAGFEGLPPDALRRYPDAGALEAALAARLDVAPEQVLATCGADDALLRTCLASLERGRNVVVPAPTFEMIPRYARLAEGEVREVPWADGSPWPLAAVLEAADANTSMVAVVTPNNPTGAVAHARELIELTAACPQALVVLDQAYAEFADEDLTPLALELPGVVTVRTLSKAWGLAGLRVGYALGPVELISLLRRVGNPYAVSGPSIQIALAWLESGAPALERALRRTREERVGLTAQLVRAGARPAPSQANFVLARCGSPAAALAVHAALAERGIAVRRFEGRADLADALRITCPCDPDHFERLMAALEDVKDLGLMENDR